MALILKTLFQGYSTLFNEKADERANDFLFMSSPLYPFVICLSYFYFIRIIGPEFMKNRPAYKLKNVLIVYNVFQVVLNTYLMYHGIFQTFELNWFCAPVDYYSPESYFLVKMVYLYFLTKMSDLLDTVFFVLRKKDNQITFLHVYHHSGMVVLSWVGVKFLPGGQSVYLGFANSIVHVAMYFYYLLTIWKSEYKRSIWWKKYITQLQLAQFLFILITFGQLLFKPACTYPKFASWFFVPQNIFMLFLFGDFYYNSYVKTKKKGCELKNKIE